MRWIATAAWLLHLMFGGLCMTADSAHAADEEARVLILNGTDPYLPAYLEIDSAMRASLAQQAERRIVYFSEPLDAQRFQVEAFEPELVALLAKKYSGLKFDVIVAISRRAFEFYNRHGAKLWPGARLVYSGWPGEALESSELPTGATAVVTRQEVAETISLARRLQPDARRVVIISGASDLDRRNEHLVRESLAKMLDGLPAEFLIGLPVPDLVTRLAAEPSNTIAIYLSQFRDRDGRPYTPREVLRAISAGSGAPVYGIVETYLGFGMVAGIAESYTERGRLIAELIHQSLAGGSPAADRALLVAPSRCVADARALQRWSLDERRLPNGCDIRFANVPVWREYWWQIALTLAVIVGQTLLITALFNQHRRRRLAEQAELAQRVDLARASRLAMAGELTGAIAHEINQPLGAILSNTDAADLILESDRDRRDELRGILADIRRDDLRASEVIHRLRELLSKNEYEREPVELNGLLSDLEPIIRSEAKRRGVTLDIQPAATATTIVGDRVQIQQVLINLVLNAMDAVADVPELLRKVVVSIAKGASGALISVQDRGRGIAPEHLTKVFDSFFSTKRKGMGLGLSITRTIVEAHGGRVWAENGPGEGALFRVELPLAAASDAPS